MDKVKTNLYSDLIDESQKTLSEIRCRLQPVAPESLQEVGEQSSPFQSELAEQLKSLLRNLKRLEADIVM